MGETSARTAAGTVLDAGALIALDRGDKRVTSLLQRALARGWTVRVPAGVLGQAWRDGRILARERRDPIVTSDPQDLRRLDPGAQIIAI